MSDSQPVDVNTDNLDDFSDLLFGKTPVAEPEVDTNTKEVTETPSATEDSDESEVEESTAAEADDGDDAPEAEVEDEVEEEAPKPKGRKPAGVRIKELTTKAYDAERRADALARELEAIKSQTKAPEEVPVRKTALLDAAAPHPDDLVDGQLKYPLGEFDPTYIAELTRFIIRKESDDEKAKQEAERIQNETQTAGRELLNAWTDKVKIAAERLPDLPKKVTELESNIGHIEPQYSEYLASTIMSLEYGPDVLNYLADHPEEARSIVDSGPTRATIALGRLEARFTAGAEVEKGIVITTNAPPPPPRTKGSGGKTGVAADTDDLDAFEKQFFVKRR